MPLSWILRVNGFNSVLSDFRTVRKKLSQKVTGLGLPWGLPMVLGVEAADLTGIYNTRCRHSLKITYKRKLSYFFIECLDLHKKL